MVVTILYSMDASILGGAALLFHVIPFEIDAKKYCAFPISGDSLMCLEDVLQVVDMEITNIFYIKVVNGDEKEDGSPFEAPKARCGGGMVGTSVGPAEVLAKLQV